MSKTKTLKKTATKTAEKSKVKAPKENVLNASSSEFSKNINPNKKRGKVLLAVIADFESGKLIKAGDKGISYDIPKITGEKYMDLRIGNKVVKHFKEATNEKGKKIFPDISSSISPEQKKDFNLKSKKLGAIGFTIVLVKK